MFLRPSRNFWDFVLSPLCRAPVAGYCVLRVHLGRGGSAGWRWDEGRPPCPAHTLLARRGSTGKFRTAGVPSPFRKTLLYLLSLLGNIYYRTKCTKSSYTSSFLPLVSTPQGKVLSQTCPPTRAKTLLCSGRSGATWRHHRLGCPVGDCPAGPCGAQGGCDQSRPVPAAMAPAGQTRCSLARLARVAPHPRPCSASFPHSIWWEGARSLPLCPPSALQVPDRSQEGAEGRGWALGLVGQPWFRGSPGARDGRGAGGAAWTLVEEVGSERSAEDAGTRAAGPGGTPALEQSRTRPAGPGAAHAETGGAPARPRAAGVCDSPRKGNWRCQGCTSYVVSSKSVFSILSFQGQGWSDGWGRLWVLCVFTLWRFLQRGFYYIRFDF